VQLQNVIPFPTPDYDMAQQDERIKGLETQFGNIRERLGKVEGRLEGSTKSTNPLFGIILGLMGTALLGYLAWTGAQIVDHGKKLVAIYDALGPQIITQASQEPSNPKNIVEAKQVVDKALKKRQKIDSTLIAEAGRKFIEASTTTPKAWDTALAFVDYQSFVRSFNPKIPSDFTPTTGYTEWAYTTSGITTWDLSKHTTGYLSGIVPHKDAAVLEELDKPLNLNDKPGSLYAEWDNIIIKLDGKRIKNIVFKDSKIIYEGGRVQMDNVYFVNCTFEMPSKPNSENLALTLVASVPETNFSAS
jgi:hypothetical protein